MAVIEIEDAGMGMSPDVFDRGFDPFFRTNREGTGLGSATVQRLVKQRGGTVQISSAEGNSKNVRVVLSGLEVS